MNEYPEWRKWIAVGIILLFIGVTIAPTMNYKTVKAAVDNDLVEVTTQACGIKGYGNTTVKLTRQQYQNLEQHLVDFRAKLNQISSREEAVPIFKEAVVELNKYGLLPNGMSVETAKELVLGGFQNQRFIKLVEKFFIRNQRNNHIQNILCLIAGSVDNAFFLSLLTGVSFALLFPFLLMAAFGAIGGQQPTLFISIPLIFFSICFLYCGLIKPINLMSIVKFGISNPNTSGSLVSLGLSGLIKVDGTFVGTLWGFTGMRITKPEIYGSYFFGSVLQMDIDYLY
jgi:hypothetical protein